MLNKKLLAVSVAALFSGAATAAIDLNATTSQALVYERAAIIASGGSANVEEDGFLVVQGGSGELNVLVNAGVGIAAGGTRFIRYDLTNARFNSGSAIAGDGAGGSADSVTITSSASPSPVAAVTLLEGGTDESTFAIFQVDISTAALSSTDDFVLALPSLDISQTEAASITFAQYTDFAQASNKSNSLNSSVKTGQIASISTSVVGTVSKPLNVKATVSSEFKKFLNNGSTSPGRIGDTLATVGSMDVSGYNGTTTLDPDDSMAIATADVLDISQKLVFSGDFTFGKWTVDTGSACASGTVASTLNGDKNTLTTNADVTLTTPHFLCLENGTEKDVINRGSYSVALADTGNSGSLGVISYDTTSVAIPYLTTFSDYNQRVYLINSSSRDAAYTTSFRTETGVTATAGAAATGTIPANSVLAIRASDIVTLDGRTRTSATIEIEANQGDIKATTQTINLSDGSTDTVDLVVTQ
ncbi:hypothetical protein [Agaribacter flavus]|uniref:Uncharacterized protein n=1 Tax=Agaribacter flavus TaxID=1902781 RepID=A0ABV7FRT2_9ALTE